jgi:hypothetical protein
VSPLELLRTRVLPALCLLGLLGIHLPLVQGRFGLAGVDTFRIGIGAVPEFATGLTVLVLVLCVLPVVDLVRGGSVFTPGLWLPAGIAAVPAWALTGLAGGVAGSSGWLAYLVPRDAVSVDLGAGAVLLPLAATGLAVVAVAAVAVNRLDDGAGLDDLDDLDEWRDPPPDAPPRAAAPGPDPDL